MKSKFDGHLIKLLLCIFLLTTVNSKSLQAQVECIHFEYGSLPAEFARKPSINFDLNQERRTMLNQFKLGADLMIASVATIFISMIPGAVYYAEAKQELKRYCASNNCKCSKLVLATTRDYWLPGYDLALTSKPQGEEIKNRQSKTVGQFYWYLPSFFSAETRNANAISLLGFTVAAGDEKRPRHLADIGIKSYESASGPIIGVSFSGDYNTYQLGYVYHYSTDYDTKNRSQNLHVGIGTKYTWGALTYSNLEGTPFGASLSGYYFRLGYFSIIPQNTRPLLDTRPLLVGFNLEYTRYGTGTLTGSVNRTVTEDLSESEIASFNNYEFAFTIGSSF